MTDTAALSRFSHRATIRNAIVGALQPIYGRDHVSLFPDDPWRIGICFEDGDVVELQIDGNVCGYPEGEA